MARVAVDFWFGQEVREAAGSKLFLLKRSDAAQAKKRRHPTGDRELGRLQMLLVGHGFE